MTPDHTSFEVHVIGWGADSHYGTYDTEVEARHAAGYVELHQHGKGFTITKVETKRLDDGWIATRETSLLTKHWDR